MFVYIYRLLIAKYILREGICVVEAKKNVLYTLIASSLVDVLLLLLLPLSSAAQIHLEQSGPTFDVTAAPLRHAVELGSCTL